jgi:hypothetical protein
MKKAALIIGIDTCKQIYPASVRHKMSAVCEVVAEGSPDDLPALADDLIDVEILFSGWGPQNWMRPPWRCFPI